MNQLNILNEIYTNGFNVEILDIISVIIIISGIFIIITKNPIVSVLFLISLFGSVASYLILIGLGFIGLSYLIVYIGAVSILFLFILMLINIRLSELQSNTKNSIPLALFIGISCNLFIPELLPYGITGLNNYNNSINQILSYKKNIFSTTILNTKDNLYFATSNIWDGNLIETSDISSIGNIIYTNYNLWLIISSLILLLAMVGAIIITVKQN